ncbi:MULTISPECIES: glycine--tRNA ligase [unclassified Haladaptatus]|uniref:glycine--tRNA ligase n=1 Tax=unclassified Haladaptatus TaxID=2622732 RepID=UPI00209C6311|nr:MULTISPECIES: glycine--tRNA ligase [unclassified Haladaptatus]MCO8242663.1 glycine--tRNA ligase [Haladaptatus sp. AB643]MCO8252422.1 glycine--tRNA ligase [Haladaptatus sp. AB618]
MTDLVELAKRRGFFFQSSEAYGGVSGFYVYGPQGAALKRNIEDSWRDRFQVQEGHREIEAPTIMPEPVFEASGHLDGFDDMLVECPECGESHRADHLIEDNTDIEDAEALPLEEVGELIADNDLHCPTCDTPLAGEPVEDFNLMFETDIGPGSGQPGYLRPETAQGIFVEFPRLKEYARNSLPFGISQIGKAYRNEISPRKSIIRVREFTQAELEHFIDPETDEPPLHLVEDIEVTLYSAVEQNADEGEYIYTTIGEAVDEGIIASDWIAYYLGVGQEWYERIGVDMDRFRFRQHLEGERAHYSSDCWDAEAEIDGDWVEITGYSYRSDYDLSKHDTYSDEDFTLFRQYDEPKVVERATVDPDMSYLGPEFGGAAADIAEALQTLAERDRTAFDGDEVTVEADGDSYTVPVEKTGFSVDEVKESGEHITPHVVEPSIGIGRVLYTVLDHAYQTDEIEGETRTRLALEPELAPTTVGVFPLMDKDGMGEQAREIATELRTHGFDATYDDSGNIGRRYRRQDEVGTPFCVTVDYEGLEDGTVTLRERDSTEQVRVAVSDLPDLLAELRSGDRAFSDL